MRLQTEAPRLGNHRGTQSTCFEQSKEGGLKDSISLCNWRRERTEFRLERSAPDDTFLIEEVFDHFDAIAHLDLRLFGHGQDRSDELTGLHIHEGRNSLT